MPVLSPRVVYGTSCLVYNDQQLSCPSTPAACRTQSDRGSFLGHALQNAVMWITAP